jgi:ABC-type antimicrobial peptide transport system permease subunit
MKQSRATLFGLPNSPEAYELRDFLKRSGLLLSFAATRIFQSILSGTRPLDPVVLFDVIATLLAVAVLACLAPAWRASRLDPMKALRTE